MNMNMNMNNDTLQGLRPLLSLLNQPAINGRVDRLWRMKPLDYYQFNQHIDDNSYSSSCYCIFSSPASMPVVTVSPALAPNVRNIGPLFNPTSFHKADEGRGRDRGHNAPYISPGPVFSRLVVCCLDQALKMFLEEENNSMLGVRTLRPWSHSAIE